jgi:protein-arginine kinase activator protein McsA
MEDKLIIEFDLSLMDVEDVKALKMVTIKQQHYEKASILRDYEKHLTDINELNK